MSASRSRQDPPTVGQRSDTLLDVVDARWRSEHGGEHIVVAVRDSAEAERLLRRATALTGPGASAEVLGRHGIFAIGSEVRLGSRQCQVGRAH